MLAMEVAPDPKVISRIVGNLILTGHVASSVSIAYEHLPPYDRERLIRTAITDAYAMLPEDVRERTERWQNLCDFGIARTSQAASEAPKRERTAFDGLKVGLSLALAVWLVGFGIFLGVKHRLSSHVAATAKVALHQPAPTLPHPSPLEQATR